MSRQTLVVNLFAGPGTGKSTNAARVFAELKKKEISTEIVHEFAKDLVWEDRKVTLGFQPYILGKQMYHVHRLLGQVDVIVTDSPVLLSSHIYGRGHGYSSAPFKQFVEETFKEWETLNIVLRRDLGIHAFVQAGRLQDEEESIKLDEEIQWMLFELKIKWHNIDVNGYEFQPIVKLIEERLYERKKHAPEQEA